MCLRTSAGPEGLQEGLMWYEQVASPGFSLACVLEDGAQSKYIVQQTKDKILVALRSDASSADIFRSAVHAQVLAASLARSAHQGGAITHREKVCELPILTQDVACMPAALYG